MSHLSTGLKFEYRCLCIAHLFETLTKKSAYLRIKEKRKLTKHSLVENDLIPSHFLKSIYLVY
jgi:hypothetical protein